MIAKYAEHTRCGLGGRFKAYNLGCKLNVVSIREADDHKSMPPMLNTSPIKVKAQTAAKKLWQNTRATTKLSVFILYP